MKKRIITAIVFIPLLIAIIKYLDGFYFFLLIALFSTFGLKEYHSIITLSGNAEETSRSFYLCAGFLIPVAAFVEGVFGQTDSIRGISVTGIGFVLSSFALFFYHMLRTGDFNRTFNGIAQEVLGLFYVAFLFSYLIVLRYQPGGEDILLFLLFVTWAGDTGGYFVGTWMGKKSLSPKISPKKTVEGMFGSTILAVFLAVLSKFLILKNTAIVHCLVMGIGVNILNQFGDLFESLIKRTFGVKDSGIIIPGHGGVLDRVDSLLFAAPFVFYYTYFVL